MNGALLDKEKPLVGLILVGGKSSRMQEHKAHLMMHGRRQWQVCEDTLRPYCQSVLFSTSPQLDVPITVEKSRLIEDIFVKPIGPLGGIMSAFNREDDQSYFVLACDLLFFDKNAVEFLLARRDSRKLATVFLNEDKIEPLCGIYEPAIFPALLHAWSKKMVCPRAILQELSVERVQAPEDKAWLKNINHKDEYEALMALGPPKKIKVHYYAALCEDSKRIEEELLTSAKTVGELFLELKQKYDFKMGIEQLRFALNDSLVNRESLINNHDDVVFIPPVSGG